MACNVFGNPVTDETLKRIPLHGARMVIHPIDRAREAYNMKNAEENDVKARKYVESLRDEWYKFVAEAKNLLFNIYDKICYLVLVYNATGDTIKYVTSHDYYGHLGISPYPSRIANGQWAAFLHGVQTFNTRRGCTGAVVYRGMNDAGMEIDWRLAWSNPGSPSDLANSKIYGEVREAGHFERPNSWTEFRQHMDERKGLYYHDEPEPRHPGYGGVFEGATGQGIAPVYEAMLTLKDVLTPKDVV